MALSVLHVNYLVRFYRCCILFLGLSIMQNGKIPYFMGDDQGRREGGVPGVTTPGPGPKRGPDTNCYKFTSTARYEVKLIAD